MVKSETEIMCGILIQLSLMRLNMKLTTKHMWKTEKFFNSTESESKNNELDTELNQFLIKNWSE